MASMRRGPWSAAEDAYLVQLVHTQGALNWVRIAQLIGSRSAKQCRERYHQNFNPALNHDPISVEEGLQIEAMVAEMGKRWAEIARRLNRRSDNAVKNWWNGNMNRRRRLHSAQKSSRGASGESAATMNGNSNTKFVITPADYSTTPTDYSTTHLPAHWPSQNRWGASIAARTNDAPEGAGTTMSSSDDAKSAITRPADYSANHLPVPTFQWDAGRSMEMNHEGAAEPHDHLHDNLTIFSRDSGYKSAKSTSNTNAISYKRPSPDFWNTESDTDHGQLVRASQNPERWEALSVTSHDSGFSGTTLSSLGATEVKGAPEELAEILANHPELRPLILQATEEMDPRRFDKVFIRLLKTCALDLRMEANTRLKKGAVRIIYNYRAYATSLIRDGFTSRGHERISAMNKLKFQKVEDKMKLEMFIENYQQIANENQDLQVNEDEDEDERLSMGSAFNDPDEPDLRNLHKVQDFITSSVAFSNLKSNLEDFLIPTTDDKKPAIATLQTSMEDIQWHPATADRKPSTKRKSTENEEDGSGRKVKRPRPEELKDVKDHFNLDIYNGEVEVVASLRPPTLGRSDAPVDRDVTMQDLDFEHQGSCKLLETGPSTSNQHSSSSGCLENKKQLVSNPDFDTKYSPQPSVFPILSALDCFSDEQDTTRESLDLPANNGPPFNTASTSAGTPSLTFHQPIPPSDSVSQAENASFVLQENILQDTVLRNMDGYLIQGLSSSIVQKMWNKLKRTWRPPLRLGHRRLEWICGCGDSLYADLRDDGEGTLNKLAALLPCSTTIVAASSQDSRSESLMTLEPVHHSSFSSLKSNVASATPPRSPAHEVHSRQEFLRHSLHPTPLKSPQYLELCVNSGEYLKVLGEIPTGNINNDQDLFKSIKKKYLELRGFRVKFWLLKPSAVNYVHISIENCHRVGILEKPLALPPKIEVDAKRYIYDPCPLVGGVPIPDHIFLHYMNCPNPSSKDAWLGRLPKKLDTSITHNAPAISYGWGVHIDEGPNYAAIAWTNFFVLLLSGVAAALWNFFRQDFQGAFGFSCWIIAVLNSLMCCYFFRWKHE